MASKIHKAIELLKESENIDIPPAQGAMPRYYDDQIKLIREAMDLLEEQISIFIKAKNGWNMNKYMNSNNNYKGGKRHRKTRKHRK
jgi:hypothetical protein